MNKVIMFFGAHADDMELRAAGTMAKYIDKGYRAISVMMTNNLSGAYATDEDGHRRALGPVETMEIRHREAREAADVLGVDLLAEYSPEIVVTHSIANTNPEHCSVSHLTFSAFRIAMGESELGALWFNARRQSSGDVLALSPDIVIEISDYVDIKREAMGRHVSQGLLGSAVEERIRFQGEWWGRTVGVQRAEAFKTVVDGRHI